MAKALSSLVILCLHQLTYAAINPLNTLYTATKGSDFSIKWTYDNDADMKTVDWTYKKSATATPTTIMSKLGTANAQVFNTFNVEHVTSGENGEINLIKVTKDNEGIYYCEVNYKLGTGHLAVTGTATLSVTIATSTTPTTTSTTFTTRSTTPTTTSTTPTTTSSTPTTTITTPTTSTKPTTIISTTATSTTTVDNSSDGKLAVIIVSSVVGGLLFVGIAIAALFIFHRQRNKKHNTRNQSHLGSDHHKQYKTSKSPYQQKNDYHLYNGKAHRSQVKENPLNRVSKERNLSTSSNTRASSRYDNYRPAYTMENVYPSYTSGHRFMSEYIGGNRNPKNPKHSSYTMGNMRYIDNRIFYY